MNGQIKIQENTIILSYFEAYNHRNIQEMLNLFSSDAIITFIPLGESGAGEVSELGQAIWSGLFHSFPNIKAEVSHTKFDSLHNYVCEVYITGTQNQDFAGIKNKGLTFKSDHIFVFHFNDKGKIDRISINWDHQDFSRQLGA